MPYLTILVVILSVTGVSASMQKTVIPSPVALRRVSLTIYLLCCMCCIN